jgi:7,8-dihydropterin-6-yl-methyl-4-(beta-D-ribofuranosyl)aminobenzene 5'-phosphate synthase
MDGFPGVVLLLFIACAATILAAPMASAAPGKAQITVLYDAFGKQSTMQKDWGYAALIECDGKRILFDTGNNPEILAQNAQAKGVDLTKLDFVVMSHRHGDHMGGLMYVLKVNPQGEDLRTQGGIRGLRF